ncbi:hypothetical protein WJX84_008594 [Apatococcus fuscideae]|uniref:Uncharacterized protein n=1 Tax=Apatococcus fuscideae TaxID=2026836 RepID=A0AAW1T9C5_9CHLO
MAVTMQVPCCRCGHNLVNRSRSFGSGSSHAFQGTSLNFRTSRQSAASRSRRVEVQAMRGKAQKKALKEQQRIQTQGPPSPPPHPTNVEFVVFMRPWQEEYVGQQPEPGSRAYMSVPKWMPVSVISGGAAANNLVENLDTDWGRKLYGKLLIRQLANGVYKECGKVEEQVKEARPEFKNVDRFEWGFKVRNKQKPRDWIKAENITIFPAKDKLGATPAEAITGWVNNLLSRK